MSWESIGIPGLYVQFLIDGRKDLSLGMCRMNPGVVLPVHYHEAAELYIIDQGLAQFTLGDKQSVIGSKATIYIPSNEWHGIINIEDIPLVFYWVFPTDKWSEVEYKYG